MEQIEEIKKILLDSFQSYCTASGVTLDGIARQIRDQLIPQGDDEGLLTDEEIDKEHNNWCMRRGKENLKISWRRWIAKAQRDLTRQEIPEAVTNDRGEPLLPILLTRKEFINLPMDVRRRTLARQADKIAFQDKGMMD